MRVVRFLVITLGLTFISFISCGPIDVVSSIDFVNNLETKLHVIADLNTYDDEITSGSFCYWVPGKGLQTLDRDYSDPWKKVVRYSMHLYVIDADKVSIRGNYYIPQEDIDSIPEEAILARITVTHQDIIADKTIVYPPEDE